MPLDDDQIERYSRQLVLPEIGPRGQARLASAYVSVMGGGPAAARVVAYLAAAGVGAFVIPRNLEHHVDPRQPGIRVDTRDAAPSEGDALVEVLRAVESVGVATPPDIFWIAGGRAGVVPPCAACAAAALGPLPAPSVDLVEVRDAVLGTIVATEIVKAIVDIGTSLRGDVLTYDAETATLARTAVAPRAACAACVGSAGAPPSAAPRGHTEDTP